MREKLSATCKQLIVGIIIICIVFMIAGGLVTYLVEGNVLSFGLGILLGGIIATILAIHMDHSVANALLRDSDGATKFMRKMSVLRLLIMAATLVLALTFPSVFNIIGVLLGILALKFSAYLQPLTSKYIKIK